ncbi:hypothetical protein E2C01_009543 [Portunus trituberculatus]|uniref:Uncharacterized protein n=1 Tax=Portunus trituberculatus TaxID=210409 RepID=A0A5B7D621_PORTR|nr:hypothetical protein [Portunus trituberculatus]
MQEILLASKEVNYFEVVWSMKVFTTVRLRECPPTHQAGGSLSTCVLSHNILLSFCTTHVVCDCDITNTVSIPSPCCTDSLASNEWTLLEHPHPNPDPFQPLFHHRLSLHPPASSLRHPRFPRTDPPPTVPSDEHLTSQSQDTPLTIPPGLKSLSHVHQSSTTIYPQPKPAKSQKPSDKVEASSAILRGLFIYRPLYTLASGSRVEKSVLRARV